MKPKKISSKLFLNKETIANLNNKAMGHLKGGCYKTAVDSGCGLSQYTCLIETCPTACDVTCVGLSCVGTNIDCYCPCPGEIE